MRGLEHPTLVNLRSIKETKNDVLIIFEKFSGLLLSQRIRERATFNSPEIHSFLLTMLNLLNYVHDKEIIFVDFSTDNIKLIQKNKSNNLS